MNVQYTKILELDVRHDYYRLWDDSDPVEFSWPENYTIQNDLDFIPSKECLQILRNQKLLFRKTATGFIILAQAKQDDDGNYFTFIDIPEELKLTFFIVVKSPYFQNFTNLKLSENRNKLYYFSNKGKTVLSSNYFLSEAHDIVSLGDDELELGDLVEHSGDLYEITKNIETPDGFDPAEALEIGANDQRYITVKDRVIWQSNIYKYTDSSNPAPGEIVQFNLIDLDGNSLDLGNKLATNQSQGKYIAPKDSNQPLIHSIDLSAIPPGKYTMEIERSTGLETETFYLLNPMVQPNAFGVIELFPYATNFEFATIDTVEVNGTENEESVIEEKTYTLRFKNRSTVWQYFDKEENELTDPDDEQILPLTKKHTEFSLLDKIRPDPDISIIYPQAEDGIIEKIYSKTYLNQ